MPNADHINVRANYFMALMPGRLDTAYVELSATADESTACADNANLLRATGSAGLDCASRALRRQATVRLRLLQVRDKLLEFHNRYYSANTMKLTERLFVCLCDVRCVPFRK